MLRSPGSRVYRVSAIFEIPIRGTPILTAKLAAATATANLHRVGQAREMCPLDPVGTNKRETKVSRTRKSAEKFIAPLEHLLGRGFLFELKVGKSFWCQILPSLGLCVG